MNLQGHRKDASQSRPGYLYLDSAQVWLSCQAIVWISVLAEIVLGFANLVPIAIIKFANQSTCRA